MFYTAIVAKATIEILIFMTTRKNIVNLRLNDQELAELNKLKNEKGVSVRDLLMGAVRGATISPSLLADIEAGDKVLASQSATFAPEPVFADDVDAALVELAGEWG